MNRRNQRYRRPRRWRNQPGDQGESGLRRALGSAFGAAGFVALVLSISLIAEPTATAKTGWPNPNARVKLTESGHPEVLFTFDDGPDHENTGAVLDTLAKHHIQAIFYTVGYRVAHTGKRRAERVKMLERVVRAGHLIGNHTVNHAHLCKVSADKAATEIDENREIFEKLIGMPVFLFRAPYGDRCPRLTEMLAERGIVHDHWDLDPREWRNPSTEATTGYVIRKLRNLEGRAVLLMHDTKRTTTRALPRILDWIEKENARRRKAGKKTIRILSGSEWVAQNWDVSLWRMAQQLTMAATTRLHDSTSRLVPGARQAKSASAEPVESPW